MKFARYLEETQTPEWKRAYIDYRGLKKKITAIRRAQEAASDPDTDGDTPFLPLSPSISRPAEGADEHGSVPSTPTRTAHFDIDDKRTSTSSAPATLPAGGDGAPITTSEPTRTPPRLRRRMTGPSARSVSSSHHSTAHDGPPGTPASPSTANPKTRAPWPWAPGAHPPLRELLPRLPPVARSFFDMLDGELDKVESFYCARERELKTRYETLKQQLHELQGHRRAFHEAHPKAGMAPSWLTVPVRLRKVPTPPLLHGGKRVKASPQASDEDADADAGIEEKEIALEGHASRPGTMTTTHTLRDLEGDVDKRAGVKTVERAEGEGSGSGETSRSEGEDEKEEGHPRARVHDGSCGAKHDPEEYHEAKKKLKKAVQECYRGLEVLNNYRTLNLIGFRKALKKFEKVTHIPAMQAYTIEKIEPSAISSGARLDAMLREMEELFAARFARGDKKRAQARLRSGATHKSHHFSTFRSGLMLGLSVPALVDGLYRSFQPETRAAIPSWDGLLFVYGIFAVPIIFSCLIGVNLLVWNNSRINYVFIFELDLRTKLDHREYFEIPSLLLATLFYAFWLSFARIGSHAVEPSYWALLWLVWALFIWLNPLPILFRPSRYWLARNIYRQLTSGARRVEFQDFWMGDQFCSLVFTLADLWFAGCAYGQGLRNWRVCTTGRNWGPMFALGALPFFVRFVQSIRRYADSRQWTHLVNAGKYGTGIIYYMTYYLWRASGGAYGPRFIAWCIMGVMYATYAAAWDFLMDWSFFQPHAKYPLLRSEILYPSYLPVYYIAIITNIVIRFEFVMYIPRRGINYTIRTFIAAMLEMLRRWQWNFFRLENEHLGNVDQYRVTREVPLPYSFDEAAQESDGGDEDDEAERRSQSSSWRRRR